MDNPELTTAIIACVTGLGGFITAITAYVRSKTETETIRNERDETKVIRDQDSLQMHDAIEKLKFQVDANKNNIGLLFEKSNDAAQAINQLNTQLAVVLERLDTVIDTLKEIKGNKGHGRNR